MVDIERIEKLMKEFKIGGLEDKYKKTKLLP